MNWSNGHSKGFNILLTSGVGVTSIIYGFMSPFCYNQYPIKLIWTRALTHLRLISLFNFTMLVLWPTNSMKYANIHWPKSQQWLVKI